MYFYKHLETFRGSSPPAGGGRILIYSNLQALYCSLDHSKFIYYRYYIGYFGKLEEKLKVRELRSKQGLSYKEILQTIRVSRSTISLWCKDIKLTGEQKLRLSNNKQFGQRRGS